MSIISDIERQVKARIAELEPLVQEYHHLQELLRTFTQAGSTTPSTATRKAAAKTSRGRSRSSAVSEGSTTYSRGKRAEQALQLVAAHPGITVSNLAEKMGIGPTYLYRVMPALERDGKVKKLRGGYEPA